MHAHRFRQQKSEARVTSAHARTLDLGITFKSNVQAMSQKLLAMSTTKAKTYKCAWLLVFHSLGRRLFPCVLLLYLLHIHHSRALLLPNPRPCPSPSSLYLGPSLWIRVSLLGLGFGVGILILCFNSFLHS